MLGFDGHVNTGLTLRTVRVHRGAAEVRALALRASPSPSAHPHPHPHPNLTLTLSLSLTHPGACGGDLALRLGPRRREPRD